MTANMAPQLIVALDLSSADHILDVVDCLPSEIKYFKIGLELFISDGLAALDCLRQRRKEVFLDLKLHDIPRTVARSVSAAAHHGVALLTVHAGGGHAMLSAAVDAARSCAGTPPRLVAVTTLTSLDASDLKDLGVARSLTEHTAALGEMAIAAGIDGLVCSPLEAARFRSALGSSPLLVTPGIRPAGAKWEDQKRAATPEFAVQAGANFLVVGRPILDAPDPAAAAQAVLREMQFASRRDASSSP